MIKSTLILNSLVCLLMLAGCDRRSDETGRAAAEAAQLKAELLKTKAILQKTCNERDELQEDLARISDEWENVEAELTAVMQANEQSQYQINQLAAERDAALALTEDTQTMLKNLSDLLSEKDRQISELKQLNTELQATVKELEDLVEQTETSSAEAAEQTEDANET